MKTLLATALLLISSGLISAQTYAVPTKLPIDGAVKREFAKWMRMPNGYEGLIPETFFPIGWSKDGKFAYYEEPVDDACGCYYADLIIQDMRTDKVVYQFTYRQGDLMDDKGEMPPENTIAKLWQKNLKLFSDKLAENKIVAGTSMLLPKTFTAAGRTYTAKAINHIGKNPEGDKRVDKLTFTLSSLKLGTKTLATFDHSKEQYWYTLDAGVIGAIKSPFEDRVAVIGMEVSRGWEGPPHTGDLVITGADLTSGFGTK